jgi:hypothetical protein
MGAIIRPSYQHALASKPHHSASAA